MSLRIGILGASGYGGGELLRLLTNHPRVQKIQAMSRRHAGKPVWSVHPNLHGLSDLDFVAKVDWSWLADCETPVLFAAIPHGELSSRYLEFAQEWKALGLDQNLTVIDLSADFRISDPDLYQRYYKSAHPCPEELPHWVYGFPEQNHAQIEGAKRIANPGCFASALQLGLLPLLEESGLEFVAVSGATGSSGSGMEPSETTHHPTRSNDFRAYKVLAHQHMAEVTQLLRHANRADLKVSFIPHSAPIVRGILATFQFETGLSQDHFKAQFQQTYASAKFVRLVEGSPRVAAVAGSNFADIGVFAKDGQGAVIVALDNLMKGMAGQAVQNMNIALGFDEAEGLWFSGGFPY